MGFFLNIIDSILDIKSIIDLGECDEIKRDKVLQEVFIHIFTDKWPNNIKEYLISYNHTAVED